MVGHLFCKQEPISSILIISSMIKRHWFKEGDTTVMHEDRKFFMAKPDRDFDPEHNKKVIQKTIELAEQRERDKFKALKDGIGERAEAIAAFLKSKHTGTMDPEKAIEKYFGQRKLEYLQSKQIHSEFVKMDNGKVMQKLSASK